MFRDLNASFDDCFLTPRKATLDPNRMVVIDQFSGQEFNLNDAGWIRNDLAAAVRAQSLTEYQAIVNRLTEIKQNGGISEDMSIDDAISAIKPRWAQSPNELEIFVQMSNDSAYSHLNDAYEKATAGKIKPAESEDNGNAPIARADGD